MQAKLLLTLCLIFASHIAVSQDEQRLSAETIPFELLIGSNAVMRLDELKIHIESRVKMTIEGTRIITVLNEHGDDAVGAAVGYDNFRKIRKIEAEIFDSKGNEIEKIKKRDFLDHSAVSGGTLYSDSRVLYMDYTPRSYPYTVKFTYEIETPNTAAIYAWRPVKGYNIALEESRYIVIDEAQLGLRFKEKNFEEFEVESNNEETSLSYSLKNLPAFKFEEMSPSLSHFTPQVLTAVENFHFNGVNGHAKDWREFGDWVNDALLQGRDQVTEQTKAEILRLTAGVEDPIEKAKIVYQFVQDNTRYISVQVGIGGVQPISALEVDQVKYGDCKGLTNYTQALLKIADIESYYTIVESGKKIEDFEDDFATLAQGNHIILGIPKEEDMIWLDCTSQIHPFGFIGDFTDNRKVLMVKPEESRILKTTIYQDVENSQHTKAIVSLSPEGHIKAKVNIETKGIQYDNRFYVERYSDKDQVVHYKNYWGYLNNLDIVSNQFNNDQEAVAFKESIELNASKYASVSGDRLIFSPNIFDRNTSIPERYRSRKTALVIERGYLDEDEFEIEIPTDFEVEAMPDELTINSKFGEYTIENELQNNKIVYRRKLVIKEGNYLKSDYKLYRDFKKEVAKQDASIIVLKKTK
ncbi:DUF3857 domain-containing protein [Sediminibacter sp. Hel_I_10]|uniref:DUF3857 domain-containing protein n=1 Tax=Sediminibacter sp. Hel_I_10 TaxID=1392490 RepID=UPI00047E1DCB|nr:DUF3857 domain-containing protein [Sediminibacter sp. Hel_I_10]